MIVSWMSAEWNVIVTFHAHPVFKSIKEVLMKDDEAEFRLSLGELTCKQLREMRVALQAALATRLPFIDDEGVRKVLLGRLSMVTEMLLARALNGEE